MFCLLRQMPLFTNVDDLMTSWNRLETEADSEAKSPTIQVGQVFVFNSPRRPAPVPHHTTTINSGGCGSGSSKLTTSCPAAFSCGSSTQLPQVSSIGAIIDIMQRGGGNNR